MLLHIESEVPELPLMMMKKKLMLTSWLLQSCLQSLPSLMMLM